MLWFDGAIPAAIAEAKKKKFIFVVFICGDDEESVAMSASWEDPEVTEAAAQACVAIKLQAASEPCMQFSQIYPLSGVPSSYFIGESGVPLEVIRGSLSAQELLAKIAHVKQMHIEKGAVEGAPAVASASAPQPSTSTHVLDGSSDGGAQELMEEHGLPLSEEEKAARVESTPVVVMSATRVPPPSSCKGTKRKRSVLPLKEKVEIVRKIRKGESLKSLATQYDLGYSTIRDLKINADKILKFVSENDCEVTVAIRKTMRMAKDVKLDEALHRWYLNKRARGQTVSGPMLCEKAREFARALYSNANFNASQGWLQRFKLRHGIRRSGLQAGLLAAEAHSARSLQLKFRAHVRKEGLCPTQVYNAAQTVLAWKTLPRGALAMESASHTQGHETGRERIAVFACANASGTHKMKIVCVGKAARPRSLKNSVLDLLPAQYYSQADGRMDPPLFHSWFFERFVPAVSEALRELHLPQRGVILVDSSLAMPNEHVLCTDDGRFTALFMPPSIASLLQPMDQDVLGSLKRGFHRELLHKLLFSDAVEGGAWSLLSFWRGLAARDCLYLVADAWESVPKELLIRSWMKLWPSVLASSVEDEHRASSPPRAAGPVGMKELYEATVEFLEVLRSLPGCEQVKYAGVEEWIKLADRADSGGNRTAHSLTATSMSIPNEGRGGGSNKKTGESVGTIVVSHSIAVQSVDNLLLFLTQQPILQNADRMAVIKRLRDDIIHLTKEDRTQLHVAAELLGDDTGTSQTTVAPCTPSLAPVTLLDTGEAASTLQPRWTGSPWS
ncbi:UBX domain-containing protein 4 isoform X1 [Petromyzon marinus]|uniref:UBX domain-containing protein 4 isoform X1 n=1 Tax=Petromyzon marinus TaxID=7757 RepID=UPI003F714DE2